MADRMTFEAVRQQGKERREIVRLESLERRELPEHRAELRLELQDAAGKEPLDRRAGFRQHGAMRGETRPLEGEHEIVGRLVGPAAEALWPLTAVEGAVDLDRGQRAARKFELARLRQALRIEGTAPRFEDPSPDADPDHGPILEHDRGKWIPVRPARAFRTCDQGGSVGCSVSGSTRTG